MAKPITVITSNPIAVPIRATDISNPCFDCSVLKHLQFSHMACSQSPLYKLHKDYLLLMPSTWNPRSFKMINHGFIEIRHDVVKTNDEKIV